MDIEQFIDLAIKEDMPNGDITTEAIFSDEVICANLIAKADGIIAGCDIFTKVFTKIDASVQVDWQVKDGDSVTNKQLLATITGNVKSILKAERIGLNFLQHLSGIATKTNLFVKEIDNDVTKIYDTRKTLPLYRQLQKQAVVIGGGENHRFSLSDQAMIKDNHIKAAGSIEKAVSLVRKNNPDVFIILECETFEQVEAALTTTCDVIMLDNMNYEQMEQAVKLIDKQKLTEASGNMTVERIKAVADLNIDRISVGELTHSVNGLDISLKF